MKERVLTDIAAMENVKVTTDAAEKVNFNNCYVQKVWP